MGKNSAISWTDHTFNPWWGCQRVGPGCDHCYAADLDKRTGGNYWDAGVLPRRTLPANWSKPIRWNRVAKATGIRAKVFCASMADVFDNRVPAEWRADLWALIADTPYLDWIIVTKRPGNMLAMLPDNWVRDNATLTFYNVWIMATVVNQFEADRDIPKLLDVRAWVRGLSIEPQLGPIVIRDDWLDRLDWIINGQESGPQRRPFDEDWTRTLRDQCAGRTDMARPWPLPFFYKQKILLNGRKIETPELDGRRWIETPSTPAWFPETEASLLDEVEHMNEVLKGGRDVVCRIT